MNPIDYDKELENMKFVRQYLKDGNLNLLKQANLQLFIKYSNWYRSRTKSLLCGSLDDQLVEFYKKNNFDFGVKLLLWDDWCDLLEELLKTTSIQNITSETCIDEKYCIGRWMRRQQHAKLTPHQKVRLYTMHVINDLFTCRNVHIQHGKREYWYLGDFFDANNISKNDVLKRMELDEDEKDIVEQLGGKYETLNEYYKRRKKEREDLEMLIIDDDDDNDSNDESPKYKVSFDPRIVSKNNTSHIEIDSVSIINTSNGETREVQIDAPQPKNNSSNHQKALEKIFGNKDDTNYFNDLNILLSETPQDELEAFLGNMTNEYKGMPDMLNRLKKVFVKTFTKANFLIVCDQGCLKWKLYDFPKNINNLIYVQMYTYVYVKNKNDMPEIKKVLLSVFCDEKQKCTGEICCDGKYIQINKREMDIIFKSNAKKIVNHFYFMNDAIKKGIDIAFADEVLYK